MTPPPALDLPRSRWSRLWWAPPLLVLALVAGWYLTHPPDLGPGLDARVGTKVGVPVYVAALGPATDGYVLRSVDPRVRGAARVDAFVCRAGTVRTTTDAEAFCGDLEPADGAEVAEGDSLLLRITPEEAGTVSVTGLRVDHRDGLRWGSTDLAPRISIRAR